MKCYSYVVARDYGFAPNPFYGHCTLATCKPRIREAASKGDWVLGCGSAKHKASGFLVYAMQVDEKLHFNDYWKSKKFRGKRPTMNGSLKQMYGDNIYHFDQSKKRWVQVDSHHSNRDGSENEYNKKRDLKSEYVLISSQFWYFGGHPLKLVSRFRNGKSCVCCTGRGYRIIRDEELVSQFISWVGKQAMQGYRADPLHFTSFRRYRGDRG
jgi:hypothetical protein